MKKKFTFLMAALMLLTMFASPMRGWGQTRDNLTYTWTTASGQLSTTTTSVTVNSVTWSFNPTWADNSKKYVQWSGGSTNCYQIGSSKNILTSLELSTSGISGTVSQVDVKWSSAGANDATLSVSVGGSSFTSTSSSSSSSIIQTSSYRGSGSGTLTLSFTATTGIKFQQIVVTYEEASDPSISVTEVSPYAYNATEGSITYELKNPASLSDVVSASVPDGSWLTIGTITTTSVPFTMSSNANGPLRTETVTLSYTGAETKEVVITQNADPAYLCGGNVTITISDMGVTTNGTAFANYTTPAGTGGYITLTGNKGTNSNSPKFYDGGNEIRFYGGNTLTVSTKDNDKLTITKVILTFSSGENQNAILSNVGVYDNNKPGTWLGVNAPVVFTVSGSSGHRRIASVTVYYAMKLNGAQTDLAITSPYAIASGSSVTGTISCTNSANLVIADGGELICSSSVNATVYKTIEAWNTDNNTGWYLLASPITSATISGESPTVSNLITGDYDLFRYNESKSANQWENYKNDAYALTFTSFENGRGYLYRNAATQNVTFTGSTNTSVTYNLSYANEIDALKGFNIIGNPLTHDITWGDITKTNVNTVGYYTLGTDGNWTVHNSSGDLSTNKIAPMQGFLVQANGASPSVTFGAAGKNSESKANNDYIKFVVGNSQYNDVTYALFDKGDGINKIDHRNAEIPMLYIPQDGKNYAIATIGDDTQMFDLSFEAKTMGTYTISMNAKGNFSYIHLIDRLTGDDTNLLIEDYSFIGSPQDNAERFIVKLGYDNDSSTGSETFAYQSGNEIIVNGEGTLEVYDVTGRKVMNTTINGVQTVTGLNNGFYIFRLNEKTQKIVVR